MPPLVAIGSLRIRMYPNDHNPPHFHILTPDHAVAVRIDSFEILVGYIPEADLRIALNWARQNKERLSDEWARLSRS